MLEVCIFIIAYWEGGGGKEVVTCCIGRKDFAENYVRYESI
jgi:hypothetical protein